MNGTAWRPEAQPEEPKPDPPAPKKETPYQKHLRELRIKRYNEIIATIPAGLPREWELACKRYAFIATQNYGKRTLSRVVWPWKERPQVAGVKRGRPRPNNP